MTPTRSCALLLAAAAYALTTQAVANSAPLVAVDIGHTVEAPGAISARGRPELAFNHDLAHALIAALQARGIDTVLVNADGHIESLQARPAMAPHADLFISIHHDSTGAHELTEWEWMGTRQTFSDRWAGHSMFVSRRNPQLALSVLCGRSIGARLQRAGFEPTHKNGRRRGYMDYEHAVHHFDNLIVLYNARQAALLFEAGVIKNRDEELLLRDPVYQARMADEMATGIAACLTAGR